MKMMRQIFGTPDTFVGVFRTFQRFKILERIQDIPTSRTRFWKLSEKCGNIYTQELEACPIMRVT
jgi:hypothetical protein